MLHKGLSLQLHFEPQGIDMLKVKQHLSFLHWISGGQFSSRNKTNLTPLKRIQHFLPRANQHRNEQEIVQNFLRKSPKRSATAYHSRYTSKLKEWIYLILKQPPPIYNWRTMLEQKYTKVDFTSRNRALSSTPSPKPKKSQRWLPNPSKFSQIPPNDTKECIKMEFSSQDRLQNSVTELNPSLPDTPSTQNESKFLLRQTQSFFIIVFLPASLWLSLVYAVVAPL